MTWRAQIRPASFRGVSFGVTGASLEAGRRTVLHEFPQRDEPFAEDMGAASQKFTLEAFVLGPDYLSRRDQLEKALQNPDSGKLVHPWYGEIEVAQFAPYKVRHSAKDGGMCVFSLSFVRVKKPDSPSASVNPSLRALLSGDLAGALSCEALDNAISFVSQAAWVVQQSVAFYQDAASLVKSVLGGDFTRVAAILENALGMPGTFSLGVALWDAFSGLFADSESETGAASSNPAARASRWAKVACLDFAIPDPPHAGSARQTIRKNSIAFASFIRQVALIEACKTAVANTPASRTAAQTLKDDIVSAFDAALGLQGPQYAAETVENLGMNETAFQQDAPELQNRLVAALAEMRGLTLAAIAESARRAPEVEERTPSAIMPALVLCHRFTGSATLSDDLVARNSIVHPGFVPVAPLEVLVS